MNSTDFVFQEDSDFEDDTDPCPPSFEDTEAMMYISTASYSIIFLLSIVGNSLVIATIYRNPLRLRTTVHIFIGNMAVSDVLAAMFVAPVRLSHALDVPFPLVHGIPGAIICRLSFFMANASFVVSVLSIVVISVERFQAVVLPRHRALLSTRYRKLTIAAIWLIAALYYSWYFYVWRIVTEDGEAHCISNWEPAFDNFVSPRVYIIVDAILFMAIPAVLLTGLYGTVLFCLKRQEDTFRSIASLERHQERQKRNQNITAMLVTVVVIFYLTWVPLVVYYFLMYFSSDFQHSCYVGTFDFVATLLALVNTAINPFVYFILNKTYRHGMCKLMCFICPCRKICCRKFSARLEMRDRTRTGSTRLTQTRLRTLSGNRTDVMVLSVNHI